MDAEIMAMEGPLCDVSFRGTRRFQPGCVALAGSVTGLLAGRIVRREDAVIYGASFANEAKPLALGFRNKSYDLAHLDSL